MSKQNFYIFFWLITLMIKRCQRWNSSWIKITYQSLFNAEYVII